MRLFRSCLLAYFLQVFTSLADAGQPVSRNLSEAFQTFTQLFGATQSASASANVRDGAWYLQGNPGCSHLDRAAWSTWSNSATEFGALRSHRQVRRSSTLLWHLYLHQAAVRRNLHLQIKAPRQ
jgi:hypothetical protein